jgi:hypothetical protein
VGFVGSLRLTPDVGAGGALFLGALFLGALFLGGIYFDLYNILFSYAWELGELFSKVFQNVKYKCTNLEIYRCVDIAKNGEYIEQSFRIQNVTPHVRKPT